MMRIKPLQTALLAAGLLSLSPLAMARDDAVGLGNLGINPDGYGFSTATALNAAGQVARYSDYYSGGVIQGTRAFLWSAAPATSQSSKGRTADTAPGLVRSRANQAWSSGPVVDSTK